MGKHLSRASRIGIIAAAAPIALVAWASVVFALDRVSNGGEILGGVAVGGVELSGLSENQARLALQDLEAELAGTPIVVRRPGDPLRAAALRPSASTSTTRPCCRRPCSKAGGGGLGGQFRWWVSNLGGRGSASIELAGTWDPAALEPYLETWEKTAIADPPFEGGITVENGNVIPQDPRPGTGIDREATIALVDAAMLDMGRERDHRAHRRGHPRPQHRRSGHGRGQSPEPHQRARWCCPASTPTSRCASPARCSPPPCAARWSVPADDPQIELSFALEPLLEYLEPRPGRDRVRAHRRRGGHPRPTTPPPSSPAAPGC